MKLPPHRLAVEGRTYNAPWDAGITGPGAAIERPRHNANHFGYWIAALVGLPLIAVAAVMVLR